MKKGALKAFAIFTGILECIGVCWSVFNTCACNFLKKDSKQVFSCQYCEILKKAYFEEHLRTTVSIVFSQDEFTLRQRYGNRGSGDVYLDTFPIKHLRWSYLPK